MHDYTVGRNVFLILTMLALFFRGLVDSKIKLTFAITLLDIRYYFTRNCYSGTCIKAFGSHYIIHMKLSVSKLNSSSTRNQHRSHQKIFSRKSTPIYTIRSIRGHSTVHKDPTFSHKMIVARCRYISVRSHTRRSAIVNQSLRQSSRIPSIYRA